MNLNDEYKQARLSAVEGAVLSDRTYNLVIGLVVLWGLFVNMLMYKFLPGAIMEMNYLILIILYIAGSIGGMMIVYKSPNPAVSFLGFTILAAAMGLLLTSLLSYYSPSVIQTAVRATGVTTCIMIVLALIKPEFFLGLGRTLITSLCVCLAVQVVGAFIFRRPMSAIDWLTALIFCGYISYDWSRAQMYPRTLDNAIDCAADIYVDIVNLFIRLLRILSRNKKN